MISLHGWVTASMPYISVSERPTTLLTCPMDEHNQPTFSIQNSATIKYLWLTLPVATGNCFLQGNLLNRINFVPQPDIYSRYVLKVTWSADTGISSAIPISSSLLVTSSLNAMRARRCSGTKPMWIYYLFLDMDR